MRLPKKINNNFALAQGNSGKQIIVEGQGIGFYKMPCEVPLSFVTRSYYMFGRQYVDLLKGIPQEVIDVANMVYSYATTKVGMLLSSSFTFTLTDHLSFCIERKKKNIRLDMPIYNEVKFMYPEETEIGKYAIQLVKDELKISLPEEEAYGIALTVVNSKLIDSHRNDKGYERWLREFVRIIENRKKVTIDPESFSYSRFVSHIQYLYRRINEKKRGIF